MTLSLNNIKKLSNTESESYINCSNSNDENSVTITTATETTSHTTTHTIPMNECGASRTAIIRRTVMNCNTNKNTDTNTNTTNSQSHSNTNTPQLLDESDFSFSSLLRDLDQYDTDDDEKENGNEIIQQSDTVIIHANGNRSIETKENEQDTKITTQKKTNQTQITRINTAPNDMNAAREENKEIESLKDQISHANTFTAALKTDMEAGKRVQGTPLHNAAQSPTTESKFAKLGRSFSSLVTPADGAAHSAHDKVVSPRSAYGGHTYATEEMIEEEFGSGFQQTYEFNVKKRDKMKRDKNRVLVLDVSMQVLRVKDSSGKTHKEHIVSSIRDIKRVVDKNQKVIPAQLLVCLFAFLFVFCFCMCVFWN